ncbi:MAG: 16S rRNA (guanine(527)-N(7))-methyltransferase RsmG [Clostridia bacterium]|nr:16S rRNA (guanine(527)-N(7))-methyltransferase RsmG [Clostridia bacterium]
MDMKQMLLEGCAKLGIPLSNEQADKFLAYSSLLLDWNNRINLTAITDAEAIVTKHFLDSLTPILTGKICGSLVDVGTGAGFPGIPLKIVCPDIKLTLLDSLNKRVNFLQTVSESLKLEDVTCIHKRAEDGGKMPALRGSFDVCLSRAVANMAVLCELCLPFVKVGGTFMALKGPLADEELLQSKRAISILGGEIEDIFSANIPFTNLEHKIIIIKKVRQTPPQYPRKAGIPTKSPIK